MSRSDSIQIYIDDSGTAQNDVRLLAGYIGRASRWTTFSTEWANVLAEAPTIKYFKAKEAVALQRQFGASRFTDVQRDAKVSALVEILNKHARMGVAVYMPHDYFKPPPDVRDDAELKGIFEDWTPSYFVLFYDLMRKVLALPGLVETGIPIEFIFDAQPERVDFVLDAFEHFRGRMGPYENLLVKPQFADDQVVLPLQAADMFAWYLRRGIVEGKRDLAPYKALGVRLQHLAFALEFDIEMFNLAFVRAGIAATRRQEIWLKNSNIVPEGPGVTPILTKFLVNPRYHKKRTPLRPADDSNTSPESDGDD